MSTITYPSTLPGPVAAPVSPVERRLLSSLPGPRNARPMQRDRLSSQTLEFVFNSTELAAFTEWLDTTLVSAGAWFGANWPLPAGGEAVRRFVGMPSYPTYYPNVGWRISAQCEVRGRGSIPTNCVMVPFVSIDNYVYVSGNIGIFSLVTTPYGPGLFIASQTSGTISRIKQPIARDSLVTVSAKFMVSAVHSDDAARFDVDIGAGSTLSIVPLREAAIDGNRRAWIAGLVGSLPISSAQLVIGEWYQVDLLFGSPSTCVLTRLSTGTTQSTTLTGVSFGTDLVDFSFSADAGGQTCPTTYTDIHIC